MEKQFKFKQFTVNQDQCAMKIGTDCVLLGAWASVKKQPFATLDIGAGTGILSLMLAQRSNAEIIDAFEIDEKAYEQCVYNFETSPWSDRLFCYHADLAEFTEEIEDKYDLIICNPPFYSPTLPSASLLNGEKLMSQARRKARFQDAMPFNYLVDCVSKLLMDDGTFCSIIPFKEEGEFIALASAVNLKANKICRVRGAKTSKVKRSLIEMSFRESDVKISELIIENSRHDYTVDYINMTRDFYLKM